MKKVLISIFFFSFFILLSSTAKAEVKDSVKIASLSLSSGDGVLSQGLLFESNFTYGEDLITLYLGERDLAVSYLKSFCKGKIYVGPVLEYYLNLPTPGAQLITSPIKNVSTFSWVGFSAGNPGEKVNFEKFRYLFYYQSVEYTYKRFSLAGVIMEYGGWQPIVDLKYKQPLWKDVELFTSAGYNFFGAGHTLLRLGITYKR
ncbi:MAG: hypothetical protein ACOYL8_04970 [Patescibacteria group bacterium]